MSLVAGIVAVATLYLLLQVLRNTNPAVLARGLKLGGGIVCLAVAAFVGVRGELIGQVGRAHRDLHDVPPAGGQAVERTEGG